MSRYTSVGIDIGTHTTRVAIAEAHKGAVGFKIIGNGEADSSGLRQGYVVNGGEVTKSIRRAVAIAEKKADVKVRSALISIGGVGLSSAYGSGSAIVSRIDGEITEADIEKVLMVSEKNADLSNGKIIHRFPISFKIDGKEALGNPQGMHGMKLEVEVLFVTCLSQHLENIIHAVEKAGIDVEDVVAAPLSASVVTLSKTQRMAGCVLLNIGSETVSIGVFENDYLISLHVFPIGSTDITNDIALGLRVSLEDAENLKKTGNADKKFPQKKLDTIIASRLQDIFDLIESHLKKIKKNELLPAGIIIIGGGSETRNIEEIAKASLKIPARVALPRTPLGGDLSDTTGWSVVYGLCVLGVDKTYHSDLFQIHTAKIKDSIKETFSWLRQFLP